jgi:rare lipoprotein A
LSRPHINWRAGRARPALLGASLTCAAALTVMPVASADAPSVVAAAVGGATATPTPPAGSPLGNPGLGGDPTGVAGLPRDPLAAAVRVRTSLRIGHAVLDVLEGRTTTVTGVLRPARAGVIVKLQRHDPRGWRTILRVPTRARGAFIFRYTPHRLLTERLRVLFAGDVGDLASHHAVGRLSSYRLAGASWYGGGGSLACGGRLTGATMGVANKTLPCGTLVTLRYGGHSVRVPVVDRGPYVAGREFDLTEATKHALGFEGVGEVWSTR